MKPSFSLPFMNNQPVSPADLLVKLSNIKSANEASNMKLKQLREVEQNLTVYEGYCVDVMNNLKVKMSSLNKEVNELKRNFKKAQDMGVINFDRVQKMLEKTLDEYENDRRIGQQMIEKMTVQIQQKLQRSILQKSMQSSQLCEQYLKLNNRLQSIVQSLESMQSQFITQYSKLKVQMNERFINLEKLIHSDINQTQKNTQNLINKINKIEQQCDQSIHQINQKKQQKRYQLHQIMEKIIQDAVEKEQ